MGVAEAIGVDFAERLRIAIGGELVGHRNRVIPESLYSAGDLRTARIEPKDGRHDRVQTLGLTCRVRVRSSAVAESVIAPARVEQSVVGISRLGRGIEFGG